MSKEPSREPIVEVRGLTNRFGEQVVHEELDLSVRRGETRGGAHGQLDNLAARRPCAPPATAVGLDLGGETGRTAYYQWSSATFAVVYRLVPHAPGNAQHR